MISISRTQGVTFHLNREEIVDGENNKSINTN